MELEYDDLQPGVSEDEVKTGWRRIAQIVSGVVLVLLGIVMSGPGIPGPGLVVIMVGLNQIKPDNAIVRYMRRKIPGIPEEGAIPKKQLIIGGILLVLGSVAAFFFGPPVLAWFRELVGI